MNPQIITALFAILIGIIVLVWSADRFVEGAATVAGHLGMPALLIGMLVVGFGTSSPEIVISILSAQQDRTGIALGNAFGSNISNIALILGITAIITPIAVQSRIVRVELPILTAATLLVAALVWDGDLSSQDAWILLTGLILLTIWTIWQGLRQKENTPENNIQNEQHHNLMGIRSAIFWLILGLVLMVVSSNGLVWGAKIIAQSFGISDLVIGLTIIAIGTSLPELASSITAAHKGEPDLVLGGVIGSNLFNTFAVVGIAGAISPTTVEPEVFPRDAMVMLGLTLSLFILCWNFGAKREKGQEQKRQRRINRAEGVALLLVFICYTAYLLYSTSQTAQISI